MIYCKQIPPEYQESPIFSADLFPENIVVTGNRDYNSHTTPEYDRVLDTLESYQDALENPVEYGYSNATEAAVDLLQPVKGKFSTRNIHALKGYFSGYGNGSSLEDNDIIARVLSLVTGQPWEWSIIRGCYQGDWQEVFYPVNEWGREALAAFEVEYFNTGSEWIIHDEENAPEGPEDISGYSCYIVASTEEGIRKELAEMAGCVPSDLVMWAFEGFTRIPEYKAV